MHLLQRGSGQFCLVSVYFSLVLSDHCLSVTGACTGNKKLISYFMMTFVFYTFKNNTSSIYFKIL